MRDLKKSDRNKVVLADSVSGDELVIFYMTPTAPQVKAYRQQSIKRKGDKMVMDTFTPGLRIGLEIITGIGEGCFGYDGEPISSDPASPHFRKDWKELLKETACEVVLYVAQVAFDGVKIAKASLEFDLEEVVEDIVPLEPS